MNNEIVFADLNRDSKIEILVKNEKLCFEPYEVTKLYSYDNKTQKISIYGEVVGLNH